MGDTQRVSAGSLGASAEERLGLNHEDPGGLPWAGGTAVAPTRLPGLNPLQSKAFPGPRAPLRQLHCDTASYRRDWRSTPVSSLAAGTLGFLMAQAVTSTRTSVCRPGEPCGVAGSLGKVEG